MQEINNQSISPRETVSRSAAHGKEGGKGQQSSRHGTEKNINILGVVSLTFLGSLSARKRIPVLKISSGGAEQREKAGKEGEMERPRREEGKAKANKKQ